MRNEEKKEVAGCINNESRYLVSRNIKIYRRKAGMTQSQLAERIDKTVEMVCQLENNVASTKLSTLDAIADVFGIETYVLFLNKDRPNLESFSPELTELMFELEDQSPEFVAALGLLLKTHQNKRS